jgi:2-keto-4-pentenoate hydratase
LGDPRLALTWIANELSALGVGLKPGEFVTTGTCMVPIAVEPGDRVDVDFGIFGQLSAVFAA